MALPSQTGRSTHRRTHMFRKRRFGRIPLIAAGVGFVAIAVWIMVGMIGGSDSADQPDDLQLTTTSASQPRGIPRTGDVAQGDASTDRGAETPVRAQPTPPSGSAGDRPAERTANRRGEANESTAALNEHRPEQIEHSAASASPRSADVSDAQLAHAFDIMHSDPLAARRLFSDALRSGRLSERDEQRIIDAIDIVSDPLVFSPTIVPNDPFALRYVIRSGDRLSTITRRNGLLVDWRFIQRINELKNENLIRAGDSLKLITGPFHAIVHKAKYRLDLYLGEGDEQVYVRSFRVGLGEYDSTPVGRFMVGTKAINPEWINPRTRQQYLPDDPANPIGEHWLELNGIDDSTMDFTGYGIHGTIEHDSIGRQASMGCVRMLPDDVELIYEVLQTNVSIVEIRP